MNPTSVPAEFDRPAPHQLQALREQLVEQARFRVDQLEQLAAARPGTTGVERDIVETLRQGAQSALGDVQDALTRMAAGTYGRCTSCGRALPLERLEVLPQVAQCLPCLRAAA